MNESQLVILFNQGVLMSATLVSNPMGKGYLLQFGTKNGDVYTLSSFRSDARVFKTFDLAARVVQSIGFKSMTVIF
jgi:hypothetical protein